MAGGHRVSVSQLAQLLGVVSGRRMFTLPVPDVALRIAGDVLDRVDQFPDFHPRQHYALTIAETELTPVERQAMGAKDVDEIELEL